MKGQLAVYTGISNTIVLCVDRWKEGIIGNVYHAYSKEAVRITSFEEMVRIAEDFFDDLGYPQMTTNIRGFMGSFESDTCARGGIGNADAGGAGGVHPAGHRKKKEMVKIMDNEALLEQRGDLGTFVIRVQHRQHSSWQGKVTWLENDETVCFRSALELMKMIDSALEHGNYKK